MVPFQRFCRQPWWMVFSVVYFILAGTGLAAVSEFRVNTYTANNQMTPSLAMNDDGNFVIAWQSNLQDGAEFGIYAQRYDRYGNPVSDEFRVNTQTVSTQESPAVAMDAAGNFVIAWQSLGQDEAAFYGIYAQRYDPNGNPVGGEFKVNTHIVNHQAIPSVSMNASGSFVIAWQSFDQDAVGGFGIYAQRYDSNGNPAGGEFRANTQTVSIQVNPAVAMDAAGNFVIAWQSFGQDEAASFGIYAQRYDPNGNPVGGEFKVNTHIVNEQVNPAVSMDAAGNFVVCWQSNLQDGDVSGIYAQRYDPNGNPVGGEFKVNTHIAGNQIRPAVSMNAAGNFVIAWQSFGQDEAASFGIYAQRYAPNGDPLGTEFKVNTHTADQQEFPSISLNAAGNFVIVWLSNLQDGSLNGIYAQRFDPNGNLIGSESPVNTYTASMQQDPSAAMDAAGNFVIAWQSFNQDAAGAYGIYAQRYDLNGTPLGTEFKVNTHTASNQASPAMAMNAAGSFVVAWQSFNQDAAGAYGIYAQRYDPNGITLGAEFKVNTFTAGSQSNPAVAMDRQGNFLIVWQSFGQDEAGGNGVYAQRFDAVGNPLGIEFKVNTFTAGNQDTPDVAMNPEGRFVIVWESFGQDQPGTEGIYAQRFDADGNPVGGEFRVNTYTADSQDDPKVAMDREGNFVVVWESNLQDGSNDGVYAQRFDRNGTPLGIEFRVNTYTLGDQDTPDVVMDRDGNFVIAWESTNQDGSFEGVYARRYDRDGNPLGGEFRINTFTDGNQGTPALAMAPHGQWVIAWDSFGQDGDDLGVFMKLFIKNFGIYLPLILS